MTNPGFGFDRLFMFSNMLRKIGALYMTLDRTCMLENFDSSCTAFCLVNYSDV